MMLHFVKKKNVHWLSIVPFNYAPDKVCTRLVRSLHAKKKNEFVPTEYFSTITVLHTR